VWISKAKPVQLLLIFCWVYITSLELFAGNLVATFFAGALLAAIVFLTWLETKAVSE